MKEFILILLTMPGIIIIFYLIGLLSSRPKNKLKFFSVALFLMFIISFSIFSKILSYPLLSFVKEVNQTNIDSVSKVIVLTGGIYKNKLEEWKPSLNTKRRILLAKEFFKNKTLPLIISGGITINNAPSEALVTRNYFKLYDSIIDGNSINTFETAKNLSKNCSSEKEVYLLITDKLHSLRSYLSFKSFGCNVLVYNHNFALEKKDFVPSLYGYQKFNNVVYEYLGLIYYIISLKINILNIF